MGQGVFVIRNKIDASFYLGMAYNLEEELEKIKCYLKAGKCREERLQKEWNKYGENAFAFEVLEELRKKEEGNLELLKSEWYQRFYLQNKKVYSL